MSLLVIIIIIIIINIFIAQIPCEYDQMRVTNVIQIKHNKLRIVKEKELNSRPPKTNPISGREKDLNPGPPDHNASALPLGHARLPNDR